MKQLPNDDITIVDMEASIEHMSRGTLRDVDLLLIVTEPYFRALQTAGRITPLARELGIPIIAIVANKVRTERDKSTIEAYARQVGLGVAGFIPWDESVQEADISNRSLFDHAIDGPAATAIRSMFDRFLTDVQVAQPV